MKALVLGVLILAGCAAPVSSSNAPTATATQTDRAVQVDRAAQAVAATCTSSNGLPDRVCTPGAINAEVAQATISITICRAGYTATIRPAATYTNALKIDQMKAYGLSASAPGDYEEDHLIPLELGGDPRDPKNLWPQPLSGITGASEKDKVEQWAHDEVCAGRLTLADAQRQMGDNWVAFAATMSRAKPLPLLSVAPSSTFAVTITVSRYGLISASTQNEAQCTARAKLPSGNFSTAQGLAPTKVAVGSAVSWTYTTSTQTTRGTGTHTVSCVLGGTTLSANAPFQVP